MKNDDLISRSALIAEYDRVHVGAPGGARKLMQDAPAVEAVEVVHSQWRLNKDGSGTCQHCNRTTTDVWDMDNWDNYCSHCGAKMDGRKNETD